MTLKKWAREVQAIARVECERYPEFADPKLPIGMRGSGHYELVLPTEYGYIFAATPSDWRGIHKIRSDIRRILRHAVGRLRRERVEALVAEPGTIIETPVEIERPPRPEGELVYHFTHTGFLPLILRDKVLRGAVIPGWDGVLWGTTDENGDKCTHLRTRKGQTYYRGGVMLLVRFTSDGVGWHDNWQQIPNGIELVADAEAHQRVADKYGQDTSVWRWRDQPLPIDQTLIEVRSYRDKKWTPLDKHVVKQVMVPGREEFISYRIGNYIYMARQQHDKLTYRPDGSRKPPFAFSERPADHIASLLQTDPRSTETSLHTFLANDKPAIVKSRL